MSIDLSPLTATDAEDWNSYVDRAPNASPFHYYEALELLAAETDATLHTLAGFKGQEPVGILPLFERTVGPFRLVVSPPELEVYSLGPVVLNATQLTQRKRERRHRRFVERALEWIDTTLSPAYVDIRTVTEYDDLRPFIWKGFDVTPSYTYHVAITPDTDALLDSFSRDARKSIREFSAGSAGVSIEAGDRGAISTIIEGVADRHRQQGIPYALTADFVEALADCLPDAAMTVYGVRADDQPVGGMITLAHGETIYRWQGGAKPDGPLESNAILDWEIMTDAKARGFERYDLVGANLPRLCRYKAKFDPTPTEYYVARRRSSALSAASSIKQLLSV